MSTQAALSQVKQGEYIQLKDGGPVWVRGEYIRSERKYEISKADDMNHTAYKKATALVFVGFTY